MDYRSFIRQLTADILNGKKDYSNITSARDFLYIQYTFSKMGLWERVREMGRIANDKNISRGINIEEDKRNPYKKIEPPTNEKIF